MHQLNNSDAESAAWEAMWDAINTFDIYAENEFSTYACCVIRNAINNELRKQQIHKNNTCILDDLTLASSIFLCDDICNAETTQRVMKVFNDYVATKKCIVRNILLTWQSSNFEATATCIGNICNTSASYVSRVQCAFRAHLQYQLRGK